MSTPLEAGKWVSTTWKRWTDNGGGLFYPSEEMVPAGTLGRPKQNVFIRFSLTFVWWVSLTWDGILVRNVTLGLCLVPPFNLCSRNGRGLLTQEGMVRRGCLEVDSRRGATQVSLKTEPGECESNRATNRIWGMKKENQFWRGELSSTSWICNDGEMHKEQSTCI